MDQIKFRVRDAADLIETTWGRIKFPFTAYWIFRFYYSFFAALLTFLYHPSYPKFVSYSDPFSKYFLMNWQHWDTIWYLKIALQGYQISDGRSVFSPAYPYLIRVFGGLSGNYLLAAMVISTLAGCCAAILLYVITNDAVGGKSGEMAVLLLLAFPTSTFFFSAYTESLFLTFSLGMFVAAKNGRFGLACILVILATFTRYQGIILIIPLGWLVWKSVRNRENSRRTFAYVLIPILFLLMFLWARSQWMDPTPMGKVYEQYWQSRFAFPGESIVASMLILPKSLNILYFINWLDFVLLITVILYTPLVIRTLPPEYWLYQIASLFILLLRVGPGDSPLQGMGRYMLLMFPFFIAISLKIQQKKNKLILIPLFFLSTWVLAMFIVGLGVLS